MNGEGGSECSQKRRQRWQISLTDMILLVVATGVAAGIARGSREVWGAPHVTGHGGEGDHVDCSHLPGADREDRGALAGGDGCFPDRDPGSRARGIGASPPEPRAQSDFCPWVGDRMASRGHRVPSAVHRLRVERAAHRFRERGSDPLARMGVGLPAAAGSRSDLRLLAMLGIALGMGAGTLLAGPSESRRRPYWLFVPLAGLVCLLIVAEHYGTLIANLVLVAIEAVTNAMPHRLVGGPGLRERLLRVRMDAAAAAAVCLALAFAVSRDFKWTRRNEPWAASRMGRFVRFLLLVTTACAGIYLARVTIPAIHRCLAEGLLQVIGSGEVIMILGGFGFFAMGLAARVLVPPASRVRPRRLNWFSPCLRLWSPGSPGIVDADILPFICTARADDSEPPDCCNRHRPAAQFEDLERAARPVRRRIISMAGPGAIALDLDDARAGRVRRRAGGQAQRVGDLAVRRPRRLEKPGLCASWLVAALVVLCLAALPTLIVAGQVLMNLRLWR